MTAVALFLSSVLYLFLMAEDKKKAVIREKTLTLLEIATLVDRKLPFDRITPMRQDDIAMLRGQLQSLLEETSHRYPVSDIGVYLSEPDQVAGAVPPPAPNVLEQLKRGGMPSLSEAQADRGYTVNVESPPIGSNGRPVMRLQYPIFRQGNGIGFLWVGAETGDIRRTVVRQCLIAGLVLFVVGTAIVLAMRFIFLYLSRQQPRFLESLITAVPMPAIAVDHKARTIAVNDELARIYPPTNIGGMHDPRSNAGSRDPLIMRALRGEEIRSHLLKSGERNFRVNAVPIRNGQRKIIGALAVYQDITELSAMENELSHMERLRLVGQMAASITHEIRNPLAVVRGFVQLLIEKTEDRTQREYYRLILEELDRAGGIVNDFLSLAQNRVVERSPLDLSSLVKGLAPLLLADTNLRGIELQLRLADELPTLRMNPKEIKQLIINLARNSMEAMPKGGTLTILTQRIGNQVLLQIEDTGCGIPKHLLDKLFQPFYTTKKTGTGLGLAVCQSIVERHGGTISVESEEGRGTVFTAAFPAETADSPSRSPQSDRNKE